MQKRVPGQAIGSSALEASAIIRPSIATDNVVPAIARVVRIENTKLGRVKDVESLGTELQLAPIAYLE